jgi:hypothetical protein
VTAQLSLALAPSYRAAALGDSALDVSVQRYLSEAADALHMAVLALDGGHVDDTRSEKRGRAARAREHLVEAVRALSRARIYVAGIQTYAVPAVMAVQPNADDEIGRLHQLVTRLLWHNHKYLPPRSQGTPLSPEEEHQLDLVYRGLKRHARIERVTRYQWLAAAAVMVGLTPVLGLGVGALGVGCGLVSTWQLLRSAHAG